MALRKRTRKPVRRVDVQPHHLRLFHLNEGLPPLPVLISEVQDMWDVLMGRQPPPVMAGKVEAMMEVADAYYARAMEISSLILKTEREGIASPAYKKYRTGELRAFIEVARHAADLGSRRITVKGQQLDAERTGRDSRF